jgi:hypothetical protein
MSPKKPAPRVMRGVERISGETLRKEGARQPSSE